MIFKTKKILVIPIVIPFTILFFIPFDVCLTADEIRKSTGYEYDESGCKIPGPEEEWLSGNECLVILLDPDKECPTKISTRTLWESINSIFDLK